jgi:predicted RNase H-like nuclease (RuvC/YqgF family)
MKKQKKGLTVSWSDEDDSDNELVSEAANHVSAMTGVCFSDTESCDDELTYEELASAYKDLCIKSEEVCRTGEKQKVVINQLKSEKANLQVTITNLQSEVKLLSSNLENMTKSVIMLNNGINMLDEILMVGKHAKDSTGISYEKNHDNETLETKFVPA